MLMEILIHTDDDGGRRFTNLVLIAFRCKISQPVFRLLAMAPDEACRKHVRAGWPHFHEIPDGVQLIDRDRFVVIAVKGASFEKQLIQRRLIQWGIHRFAFV